MRSASKKSRKQLPPGSVLNLSKRGKPVMHENQKWVQAEKDRSLLTFQRSDDKMKRELRNQGLMYLIVGLMVSLAVPFIRFLA